MICTQSRDDANFPNSNIDIETEWKTNLLILNFNHSRCSFSRFTIHTVDLSDLTSFTIFQVTIRLYVVESSGTSNKIKHILTRIPTVENPCGKLKPIWTFHGFSDVFSPKTRHCLNYPRRAPIQRCPQQKAPPTGSPWGKADRLPLMCGHLYVEINEHVGNHRLVIDMNYYIDILSTSFTYNMIWYDLIWYDMILI